MLSESTGTDVLDLTGAASLMYFPGISLQIESFDLDATVTQILEPVDDEALRQQLRPLVVAAIIDPTNNRSALYQFVLDQMPDEE